MAEVEQYLHTHDVPAFLRERMGIKLSLSSVHKYFMPSLGSGPPVAGRWGGRPLYRPADILAWAAAKIERESRSA